MVHYGTPILQQHIIESKYNYIKVTMVKEHHPVLTLQGANIQTFTCILHNLIPAKLYLDSYCVTPGTVKDIMFK